MKLTFIKAHSLDTSFIERGNVSKLVVNQEAGRETSILTLGPLAKIKNHSHPEKEVFHNIFTGETRIYESNEVHGLENDTCETQVWVSDKYLL